MNEILNQMLLTAVTNLVLNTIGSGVAITLATEVLKSEVIPIPTEKYPRATASILSLASAVYIATTTDVGIIIDSWQEIIVFGVAILLIATNCYHVIIKGLIKSE
jgi:hypothetical protein